MRRARFQTGSVVFDKRRGQWNFLWCENGRRRGRLIGTLQEYPTKAAARRAAELMKPAISVQIAKPQQAVIATVRVTVERYREERMPERTSTRRGYNAYINNYILPVWGETPIADLKPRPVELWIKGLPLAGKTRSHIRGLLNNLVEFAMWREDIPVGVNPISLVRLKDTGRVEKERRSLTPEEFQKFSSVLGEPFRTMAFVCVGIGLRISECLALKWEDVDWLNGKVAVKRGIVRQIVDATKTPESRKDIPLGGELLDMLERWKRASQFGEASDWVFASPVQLGKLPWSYPRVLKVFTAAAVSANVGHVSPHVLRHTYRQWLGELGTPLELQSKLMRHTTIAMTMKYGTDERKQAMRQVNEKVIHLASNGLRVI